MRRTFGAVLALSAVAVISLATRPLAARPPQRIVIRVTSLDPTHAAKFHAALVFDGSPLKSMSSETPFETTTPGPLALGVFEREGDGPNFHVQLIVENDAPGRRAEGSGPRLIVGHSVIDRDVVFARPY
jgi:hypothetical protein